MGRENLQTLKFVMMGIEYLEMDAVRIVWLRQLLNAQVLRMRYLYAVSDVEMTDLSLITLKSVMMETQFLEMVVLHYVKLKLLMNVQTK